MMINRIIRYKCRCAIIQSYRYALCIQIVLIVCIGVSSQYIIRAVMKPKPWETRKKPVENISQIIQSNPTVKQQIPKLPPTEAIPGQLTATSNATGVTAAASTTGLTSGLAGTTGYGGYGGYGSSYGGYGGYGSSYGGYGGYGSYGGYGMGGMSSMYGMGRYGMGMGMGGQDQKGFLFNTMMTLDSFSYLINCLCEIAGSLDRNAQGLSLFYKSFKNLISRMESGVVNGLKWVVTKIKNFFLAIFQFIVENIFFMGQKNTKSKYRAIKFVLSVAVLLFAISCYPLLRKGIKNV